MISYLIASIICAYGISILLVEKRFDYPVRRIHISIRYSLRQMFGRKFSNMLLCTICTSFWAALVVDCVLTLYSGFSYFLWPLSGFAAAGLTWTIYEFLGVMGKEDEHGLE